MITDLAIRSAQIIFSAVVLGLSISAVEWQQYGTAPATSTYCAFAGAFGMLAALIGLAAIWVEMLRSVIMMGVDALASVFLLAGGIAIAVGLKGVSCGNLKSEYETEIPSELITGGKQKYDGGYLYGVDSLSALEGRCRKMEADAAFLFLGFIVSVGALVWMFFAAKKGFGKTRGGVSAV